MKKPILIAAAVMLAGISHGQMFAQMFGQTWTPASLNPVAWYKLDGNAMDSGSLRADGLWAGTEAYTNGKLGVAAFFNGSSCVTSAVPVPSQITMSMWSKGSVPGGATYKRLLCARNGNFWLQIVGAAVGEDNILQFGVVTNGNPATLAGGKKMSASGDFSSYRHIVGVWDNSTATMYVDGVAQTNSYSGGMGAGGDGILSIGARSDSIAVTGHSGQIDDVLIFPRALTQAEITQLYNWRQP
jgi:hypothetical protein